MIHIPGITRSHGSWRREDSVGWFVDLTPDLNEEFSRREDGALQADENSEAFDKVDLFTVVAHELGRVLGLADGQGLMSASLSPSVRREITADLVDLVFDVDIVESKLP